MELISGEKEWSLGEGFLEIYMFFTFDSATQLAGKKVQATEKGYDILPRE